LEIIGTPVGGAVFVAGWFNLKNLEDEATEKIAKPWIDTPISIVKIKKVLPKSVLIISDDDPYDAFEENMQKFSEMRTQCVVLPNGGHMTSSEEPVILSQFLEKFDGS
jgi:predicted alpha/beta hydrolase family esterase